MGRKNRHKEFQKKEKSKVKLKVKKTLLPKGQNVTDTSFKVRKIVIPEQLKSGNTEEPLSRKKLNVTKLLSHLQHHNKTMRQEGLTGLKELLTTHRELIIKLHLPQLVEGVLGLVLDQEMDVRKSAHKLLDDVISSVSSVKSLPLLDVVQSYLTCAMTHIKQPIQEDSLSLLDTLLNTCPSFIATRAYKILPTFLEMISNSRSGSQGERTLMVNLGSKLTSVRWHIKVLRRLHGLLEALNTEKKEKCNRVPRIEVYCSESWSRYVGLFTACENNIHSLSPMLHGTKLTPDKGQTLEPHLEALVPLLFASWLEVSPSKTDGVNILSEESSALLHYVLKNMQLIWEYLESSGNEHQLKSVCEHQLRQHVIEGFPYSMRDRLCPMKNSVKKHRDLKLLYKEGELLGPKCIQQNLAICHLLCCIHDGRDSELCQRVMTYVKKCMSHWEAKDNMALDCLEKVLRQLLMRQPRSWPGSVSVLDCAITEQQQASFGLAQMLFNVLCDLVLQSDHDNWPRSAKLNEWVALLPGVLCKAKISMKTIEMLVKLASRGNDLFLQKLEQQLDEILNNFPLIEILDIEDQVAGRKEILNVLFWVFLKTDVCQLFERYDNNPLVSETLRAYMLDLKNIKDYILVSNERTVE